MRLVVTLFILIITLGCSQENTMKTRKISKQEMTHTRQLRHMVLFKFNEESTTQEIEKIITDFSALPSQIKSIKDYEWGLHKSAEDLNKGFTHAFLLTFDSQDALDTYLPHTAHQNFVASIQPHVADVMVIDYWTN
ncbi:Dabb family protein [Dokdonia sp. Asnod2-E02]|uniref:Dabb family protein n=1 Tax=Dokdonia sp. Asnod2-E02 TaxID=3160574 RepID=UPI00386DF78A